MNTIPQFPGQGQNSLLRTEGANIIFANLHERNKLNELLSEVGLTNLTVNDNNFERVIESVKFTLANIAWEKSFVSYALAMFLGFSTQGLEPPMPQRFPTWAAFYKGMSRLMGCSVRVLKELIKAGIGIQYLLGMRKIPQEVVFGENMWRTLYRKALLIQPAVLEMTPKEDLVRHLVNDSYTEFAVFMKSVKPQKQPKVPRPAVVKDGALVPTKDLEQADPLAYVKNDFSHLIPEVEQKLISGAEVAIVPCFREDDINQVPMNVANLKAGYRAGDEVAFGKDLPRELIQFTDPPTSIRELRAQVEQSLINEVYGTLKVGVLLHRVKCHSNGAWKAKAKSFKEFCQDQFGLPEGSVSFLTGLGKSFVNNHQRILDAWSPTTSCVTKIRYLDEALKKYTAAPNIVWTNFRDLTYRDFKIFAQSTPDQWAVIEAKMKADLREAAIRKIHECLIDQPRAPFYVVVGLEMKLNPADIRSLGAPRAGQETQSASAMKRAV